jgi:hypothetical protein
METIDGNALGAIGPAHELSGNRTPDEARVRVILEDSAEKECNLSKSSLNARIETTLRSNGFKVKDYANGPTFLFYLSAQKLAYDSCLGHGYLQVFSYVDNVPLRWSKKKIDGLLEHCLRSFAFSGGKGFEQQEKINSALDDMARQCISSLLKEKQ